MCVNLIYIYDSYFSIISVYLRFIFFNFKRSFVLCQSQFLFALQFELVSFNAQTVAERHPGWRDGIGQNHPSHFLHGTPQGDGRRRSTTHHCSLVNHGYVEKTFSWTFIILKMFMTNIGRILPYVLAYKPRFFGQFFNKKSGGTVN